MPWSGNQFTRTDGTRTGENTWQEADAAGVKIVDVDHDTHDQDLADGINACLKKDGGNAATSDIPMGGNKFTNVGNAAARTQYASMAQLQDGAGLYCSVGGTSNAITLTSGFSLSSNTAGGTFRFKATSTNTGAVTVTVDSASSVSIKRHDGTSLQQGDIVTGGMYTISFDGTAYQLLGASNVNGDVLARVLPVGAQMWWGLPTLPAGWVKAGSTLNKADYPELNAIYAADSYPYGSTSTTFNTPPAKGRFIRVTDEGAGLDPDAASRTNRGDGTTGDAVGTLQADAFDAHTHTGTTDGHTHVVRVDYDNSFGAGSGGTQVLRAGNTDNTNLSTDTFTTASSGGNETRPVNINQFLIILASPAAASAAATGLYGLAYSFNSSTSGDPASGKLLLNNATLSSVTSINISDSDAHSADVSAWIASYGNGSSSTKGQLRIQKVGTPSTFAVYNVVSSGTDNSTYYTFTLSYIDHNGSFSNGDSVSLCFFAKGDLGSDGYSYAWSTNTSSSDPGTGVVKGNNSTIASITALYISEIDSNANDLSSLISFLDDSNSATRSTLTIKGSSTTDFIVFKVTGANTDNGAWVTLTGSVVSSGGTFSSSEAVTVSYAVTGDKGQSAGVLFNFDSSTTMSDPGSTDFRLNNATLSSVTAMAISANSADTGNPDLSDWVASWDNLGNSIANGQVMLQKASAPGNVAFYNVTSVTDNTSWLQVGLTYLGHAGSFSASDSISLQFSPSGRDGVGTGDVTAASNFSTDNRIIRSDGTGKGVQSSGVTVDDSVNMSGIAALSATTIELGHASDTTLARSSAGVVTIEGNVIYRAGGTDVPVTDGGTGASDAATAFSNLKQAATTSATGVIELATDAEVRSAATGNLALTPAHIESASAGVALTDAATVAVDWDAGINFTLTVTTNRTLGNPTNGQPGTWRTVLVQGNDTTDRTIAFDTQYLGEVPTITDCDSGVWYLISIYCISSTHFVASAKRAK